MPGKQAKVVTPPMLKRMLRHVSHSTFPARDRAMILLSVKAGLRACEIAGLGSGVRIGAETHRKGPDLGKAFRRLRGHQDGPADLCGMLARSPRHM